MSVATVLLGSSTAPTDFTSGGGAAATHFDDVTDLEEVIAPTSHTFAAMRPDENKFLTMLDIDATSVSDTDLVRV